MTVTVIGCGRWGSCIAWYLDGLGHKTTLYGRPNSENMKKLMQERKNEYMEIPETLNLSCDTECIKESDVIVISINSQGLRALCSELSALELKNKIFVLCMKGIEQNTCKRLSEIVKENTDSSCKVAVWLGPGHVEEFYNGVQNCMVIDSEDEETKVKLIDWFSGGIIRFYYGTDLIGNEIGAAAKNVIGVAAGMLDGLGLTSLKGALMSRGAREIARLIDAAGGSELSAYGLCHLGDYQATVFSPYSHNRQFGESFVRGEDFSRLAEGYHTTPALVEMAQRLGVELPICKAVYCVLYEGVKPAAALNALFDRAQKKEF
jgi:glycerol-3-phosphate dehydrogenase (NAD(P)+)